MVFDQFIIRFIVILTPGAAGYIVYRQLRGMGPSRRRVKDWQDFLGILLFSLAGYACTWIGAAVMDIFGASLHPSMLNAVLDQTVRPAYPEIIVTVLVTICLGVFCAFAINRKWAFRLFFRMNLTNSFGEDDVWSYMMNLDEIDWVIVRDHEQDLAYLAKIEVFSDSEAPRELVLREVEVHKNSTWRLLYNTDRLYICRDAHKLSVEFLPLEGQDATSGRESPHGRQAAERTETAPRRQHSQGWNSSANTDSEAKRRKPTPGYEGSKVGPRTNATSG